MPQFWVFPNTIMVTFKHSLESNYNSDITLVQRLSVKPLIKYILLFINVDIKINSLTPVSTNIFDNIQLLIDSVIMFPY